MEAVSEPVKVAVSHGEGYVQDVPLMMMMLLWVISSNWVEQDRLVEAETVSVKKFVLREPRLRQVEVKRWDGQHRLMVWSWQL